MELTPDPNFLESHPLNIRRTLQPWFEFGVCTMLYVLILLHTQLRTEVPIIDWDHLLARPSDVSRYAAGSGGAGV